MLAMMFFVRKSVEKIINLLFLSKKENQYDSNNQHQGIVLNNCTEKLEADNSMIEPF